MGQSEAINPVFPRDTNPTRAMSAIRGNLADVTARMATVAGGRSVNLVAVSKTKPAADVLAAYEAGQRHFGENYVQELVEKAPSLPSDIKWHFIGHLQTNKAKMVAAISNLYMVETVDSERLANALNRALPDNASPLRVLIQVNTSGEDGTYCIFLGCCNTFFAAKSGVEPSACATLARHIQSSCPKLRFSGVMTIGSVSQSLNEDARPNPDFAVCGILLL